MENSDEERSVTFFSCPYLGGQVELNEERERHIRDGHGELLPERVELIELTLAAPERIQRKIPDDNSLQFCRWHHDLGKYIVVVVVNDSRPRKWIVTAYVTHRLPGGEIIWQHN